MADMQSNQTRPKFQYRFLAVERSNLNADPCRLSVEASSEYAARRAFVDRYMLIFAGRIKMAHN